MGKLADLWAELASCNIDSKKLEIQKQINGIEQWMIDNKIGSIKEITDWTKRGSKKQYRFEGTRDGGWLKPDNARIGKDRCGACKYNNHVYCDPNDKFGHFANV